MEEGAKTVLAIVVFLLFLLALKPDLVGITAGSMTFGGTFKDAWFNLGGFGQVAILLVVAFVIIAILIGKEKS